MIAMALDTGIAIGLACLAALWLARRTLRALRGRSKGGACACPSSGACGSGGTMAEDLKTAAARGAARAAKEGAASEPTR